MGKNFVLVPPINNYPNWLGASVREPLAETRCSFSITTCEPNTAASDGECGFDALFCRSSTLPLLGVDIRSAP